MSEGYAIKTNDEIDLRTLSPTAKAAKVNWLVLVPEILLRQSQCDLIEVLFDALAKATGAVCVKVTITEAS
jgi:hypothetical protein